MYPKRHDHIDTEQKYRLVREAVFEEIEKEFSIQARPITLRECGLADNWKSLNTPGARKSRGGWEWAELYHAYKNKPNRFEIALCSGGVLGALSYGQTSRAGSRVRLDLSRQRLSGLLLWGKDHSLYCH